MDAGRRRSFNSGNLYLKLVAGSCSNQIVRVFWRGVLWADFSKEGQTGLHGKDRLGLQHGEISHQGKTSFESLIYSN